MNLFLTGEVQVGKSTLFNRVVSSLPSACKIGGFETITVPDIPNAIGSVYIIPCCEKSEYLDCRNRVGIRYSSGYGFVAFPKAFDLEGVRLIRNSFPCDVFAMDELGKMELNAEGFNAEIMRLLDEPVNILGVIKAKQTPLIDAIRNHPKTRLYTVTLQCQEQIFHDILSLTSSWAVIQKAQGLPS